MTPLSVNRTAELPLGAAQALVRAEQELDAPSPFMASMGVQSWRSKLPMTPKKHSKFNFQRSTSKEHTQASLRKRSRLNVEC